MQRGDIDLSGARILIVDDVPASLDLLAKALEADGYKIAVAPSPGRVNGSMILRKDCRSEHPSMSADSSSSKGMSSKKDFIIQTTKERFMVRKMKMR